MSGRVENTISAGEDVINELDLAEAFHVFVPDEATQTLTVGLEAPLRWRVQSGICVDVVIAGGNQKVAVCVRRIPQHPPRRTAPAVQLKPCCELPEVNPQGRQTPWLG